MLRGEQIVTRTTGACAGSVPCLLSLCGLNLSYSLDFLLHISMGKTLTHRLYMYLRSYPPNYPDHRLRFSKAKALFTLAPATPDYEVARLLQRSLQDLVVLPYRHPRTLAQRDSRH